MQYQSSLQCAGGSLTGIAPPWLRPPLGGTVSYERTSAPVRVNTHAMHDDSNPTFDGHVILIRRNSCQLEIIPECLRFRVDVGPLAILDPPEEWGSKILGILLLDWPTDL